LIYILSKTFRDWFEKEYKPALEFTGVRSKKYIHNIDKKGCRLACLTGEDVVVPVGIKEMYVGVPENRLFVTVVESISADGKAILPLVIVPGRNIMMSWFSEQMTGAEVVSVSPSGYTNEGICVQWLDHFIQHNKCGPQEPWRILLLDGATCHEADDFILEAKMNRIWFCWSHQLGHCDPVLFLGFCTFVVVVVV
jgi:hypothetical protein